MPKLSTDGFSRDGRVQYKGAQRAVLSGDLHGHVALEPLATRRHLYGLGPFEALQGEVTIINGTTWIAIVHDGMVRIERALRGRACFLVIAEVPAWRTLRVDVPLADEAALDATLRRNVHALGFAEGQPFPFLLRGRAERLAFHVLNKRDGLPHTAEQHELAKVRFALQDVRVDVVGFHSDRHRGIFIPGHSTVHMHMTTTDGRQSGHVDALQLSAGWTLAVPADLEERP